MEFEARILEMGIKSEDYIPEQVRQEIEKAIENIMKIHNIKYTYYTKYPELEPDDVHG